GRTFTALVRVVSWPPEASTSPPGGPRRKQPGRSVRRRGRMLQAGSCGSFPIARGYPGSFDPEPTTGKDLPLLSRPASCGHEVKQESRSAESPRRAEPEVGAAVRRHVLVVTVARASVPGVVAERAPTHHTEVLVVNRFLASFVPFPGGA